jgi:hypothetical chaperone protein
MNGVGVDFGTSNSTVAWFDGHELRFVPLEPASPILPTAIHLSRDYVGTTGAEAIDRYVQENAARLVQMVPEMLGESAGAIEDHSEPSSLRELETSRSAVYGPLVDPELPGRLFLGLKRLLGNADMQRLMVFKRGYRLVALLTPILLRLRESLQRELPGSVGPVHVGRPVDFEGSDPKRNELALWRLAEACRHAGFRQLTFYPEPLAATLSFLWQRRVTAPGVVLTVDFGGGTLDLSLVRHAGAACAVLATAGAAFAVLATAGADIGGDRIDQLIFRRMLFPHLGAGETWSRNIEGRLVETLFPFAEYEEGVLNWAITHTLNQNKYKTKLTEAIAGGGPGAAKFQRLKDLINYNYSHRVFTAIKQAKADLSVAETTSIDVPELNLTVEFTRAQFNDIIADLLVQLRAIIGRVLAAAALRSEDVDVVVGTGGSSLIVAVRDLLEERFPGKVTEHDPFTSVAGGLAIASHYGYRFPDGTAGHQSAASAGTPTA